jgi:hypothetical protein
MPLNFNIKMQLGDIKTIKNVKGVNKGGAAQQKLANLLIESMDDYVPRDTGHLKETAKSIKSPFDKIVYDTSYARRLYYNPQFRFQGSPQRGAYWDKRAWGDRSSDIITALQESLKK